MAATFSIPVKRIVVLVLAIAITIIGFSSLSTADTSNIFGLVVSILTALGGLYGIVGAWQLNPMHLKWFLLTLLLLSVLQGVFIVFSILHYHYFVRDLGWNIASLGLLLIGAVFTADLRRATQGYDDILDPILHPTV